MQQHIFICSLCVYLTTCLLLPYCDLFKTFREQSLSAWPGLVTRNSLTKLEKEKSILWGNFSVLEEEHYRPHGQAARADDQSLIRSLQCEVTDMRRDPYVSGTNKRQEYNSGYPWA